MKQTNPNLPPWVRGLFGSEEERADFDWGEFWSQVASEMWVRMRYLLIGGAFFALVLGKVYSLPSEMEVEGSVPFDQPAAGAEPSEGGTFRYTSNNNPWAKD